MKQVRKSCIDASYARIQGFEELVNDKPFTDEIFTAEAIAELKSKLRDPTCSDGAAVASIVKNKFSGPFRDYKEKFRGGKVTKPFSNVRGESSGQYRPFRQRGAGRRGQFRNRSFFQGRFGAQSQGRSEASPSDSKSN